ncbi:MAG: transposase family protein [Deltaproteobacteria bacterium]|jgi:hypothetical protein|nr:transposase family protein [Deltaproteobacteria bacterium]
MAKFLSNIIAYFKTIPDFRVKGRSTYKLYQILTILLIATTAGYKGWKDIHNFAVNYFWFFKLLLPGLENVLSVDTIARTISKIDP